MGQDKANPLAAILSGALMLDYLAESPATRSSKTPRRASNRPLKGALRQVPSVQWNSAGTWAPVRSRTKFFPEWPLAKPDTWQSSHEQLPTTSPAWPTVATRWCRAVRAALSALADGDHHCSATDAVEAGDLRASPTFRTSIAASIIGMKKHSEFPILCLA